MPTYCEHNRQKDSYRNSNCPECEVEFLHKALADCEGRRKKHKDKTATLQSRIKELENELAKLKSGIKIVGPKSIPTITDDGNVSCMPAHYKKVLDDNFDELIYKPPEE